jgi:hypothetical protein
VHQFDSAQNGRLLRLLFFRYGAVPAYSTAKLLLFWRSLADPAQGWDTVLPSC